MDFDVAAQLERIVAVFGDNPIASIGAVIAILLVLGFQKDGLFSRIFGYLQATAEHQAALEQRRIEIIHMVESRRQLELPGIERKEDEAE